MSDKTVKLASIGVGRWGQRLAEGLKSSRQAEIVTCYAPTLQHCQEFSIRFDCEIAPSYQDILDDPIVDGVLITTPNDLHRSQIEEAALHGKHIFVEKPIALTVEDARAATDACARAGVTLAVGHQHRRESAIRQLKSLIDDKVIGEIVGVEAHISTNTGLNQTPDRWRWRREQCPGGPLMQIGIHLIDTLCYLLGPITSVSSMQRHILAPAEFDDATVTLLGIKRGVLGVLVSHYVTARAIDIRVSGTKAIAFYDQLLGLEIRCDTRERAVREAVPVTANDPIQEELVEFIDCIRTGAKPEVGGTEAATALSIVLAAVESARCGQTVLLDG